MLGILITPSFLLPQCELNTYQEASVCLHGQPQGVQWGAPHLPGPSSLPPPHCIASTGVTGLLFLFLPTIPNPTLWLPPLFL